MKELVTQEKKDLPYQDPEERLQKQKKQDAPLSILKNGVLFENPVFRLVLGICPVLAITTSAKNAISMGLAVIFVLTGSEIIISLLRNLIPDKVRIPAFITIIAGFVTIVQMLVSAYLPALNDSLGIYIPLIVVNCIVLARAEAFASKKPVFSAMIDGIGMGVGFTVALFFIGAIREILGAGSFFGLAIPGFGSLFQPMMFFILPPGGFFVFGICICFSQLFVRWLEKRRSLPQSPAPQIGNCEACGGCSEGCGDKGGST